MIILFDLDNTLCQPISSSSAENEIFKMRRHESMIRLLKALKKRGHTIGIYTHRKSRLRKRTTQWLKVNKIPFDFLLMNKPKYDLLIDDKACPPYNYLTARVIEEYIDQIKKWDFNKGSFRTKNSFLIKEKTAGKLK